MKISWRRINAWRGGGLCNQKYHGCQRGGGAAARRRGAAGDVAISGLLSASGNLYRSICRAGYRWLRNRNVAAPSNAIILSM